MRFSIISLLFPFTVNALSATTALTIEGTKPYLLLSDGTTKLTNLNELLGFSMWDGTYNDDNSKHMIQIDSTKTTLVAPMGMTYSDVITLVTANGDPHNVSGATVGDTDGDAVITANTSVTGTMTATWYNGGVKVPNSDLNNPLSVCGGPYTLKIEVASVQANTTYGAPNINNYGNGGPITYTFTVNGKSICYIRPGSMAVYAGKNSTESKWPTTGYNSAVWESGIITGTNPPTQTGGGFKPTSGFPTTGFNKATLRIIGSGNDQKDYKCEKESGGSWISYSTMAADALLGAGCEITYNTENKPTSSITIKMSYKGTKIGSYTIPAPSKWAIGKGHLLYKTDGNLTTNGIFPAASMCKNNTQNSVTTPTEASTYFFNRTDLTNTPIANQPASSGLYGGFLSRDVDGTFMGEWGAVFFYVGSGWSVYDRYWTGERVSSTYQSIVLFDGNVQSMVPNNYVNDYGIICRG